MNALSTCESAQQLRSHLRYVSMDNHPVACCALGPDGLCPFLVDRRAGDEDWYDAAHGPIAPCNCCDSCRASCAKDVER